MATCTTTKEFVVGEKYRLVRKIGSGSFGDIYLGINITNGEVSGKTKFSGLMRGDLEVLGGSSLRKASLEAQEYRSSEGPVSGSQGSPEA